MRRALPALTLLAAALLLKGQSLGSDCATGQVSGGGRTAITRTTQGFQLERNGQPYPVRGACAWDHFAELKEGGGNSVRTWGAKDDSELYDRAEALGLSVCAGLWFDWAPDRPEYMRQQFDSICSHVRKYRNHPAILMWGIGNEYERGVTDPDLWKAIEELAKAIKEIDPNHPAITVVAEIDREKVAALKQHCPSLDALGVNSYGGLLSLPTRLREYGWDRPYVVTEFGEAGPDELGKTTWGAPIEPSSTYAAAHWIEPAYDLLAKEMAEGRCLGSYIYLWGVHRSFGPTATWYHLFLRSGERLAGTDAAIVAWTGHPPANRAPEIVSFRASAGLEQVTPGSRQEAEVTYRDRDGDAVEARLEILAERPAGEDPWPASYPANIVDAEDGTLAFTAPQEPGAYRLYVYLLDGKGGAATANAPFLVFDPEKTDRGGR
ncbi:MAG: glycoside hydrolase family 2 TIM barrel-domain containing protein [Armatimonadota bacterium]